MKLNRFFVFFAAMISLFPRLALAEGLLQPNIILIMTDDQGWFDVGFNGNLTIKTPELDRLAAKGIIFERFYSASAVCSPTRASVLTGRNPLRMGIPTANSGHLKTEEITIAEVLKEQGYATGHFGKWHLGTLTRKEKDANRGGKQEHAKHYSIPSMHGYDVFFCSESKVPTYDPMVYPENFQNDESKHFGWTAVSETEPTLDFETYYWIGEEKKETENLSGDDTRIIMDRVIPFIHQSVDSGKPFFTTIWTHTPHLPIVANQELKNLYPGLTNKQQLYYGSISALDEQIGRLWKDLEVLGIEDSTMIWFCSDNGPENKTPGSQGKFRGRKRSLYEGGLRTPAFLVWKSQISGGTRSQIPVFTSDYLPTILQVLDIPLPECPLDGLDLTPYLLGNKSVREKPMGFLYKEQISWVNHQYKLISKDDGETWELYDLLSDPYETHNTLDQHPEIFKYLKHQLNLWVNSVEKSSQGLDYL